MRKRLTNFAMLLSVVVAMSVASCTSYKKVPYLQNSRDLDAQQLQATVYEPVIQPNDLLNIVVNSGQDEKVAIAYNLPVQSDMQAYIVNAKGCVNVPNVGEVSLAGLTISQAEEAVLDKVKGAFAVPPVVIVRFADYKISVLGEVAAPGTYNVANGKVNVFQALALARDMTIHGLRENVKVIREGADGKTIVGELDLTDASVISSPFYQLQQNDIVYVTPNKAKAKGSDVGSTTSLWFSATSILVSLTSLLYNILK